jgi:hypothetical protein
MKQRYTAGSPECEFHIMEAAVLHITIKKNQAQAFEQDTSSFVDRRKSARICISKQVTINFKGLKLCNCIVKNISTTGAQILVTNQCWVPKQFFIYGLLANELIFVSQVWNKGQQIGVKFLNVIPASDYR